MEGSDFKLKMTSIKRTEIINKKIIICYFKIKEKLYQTQTLPNKHTHTHTYTDTEKILSVHRAIT